MLKQKLHWIEFKQVEDTSIGERDQTTIWTKGQKVFESWNLCGGGGSGHLCLLVRQPKGKVNLLIFSQKEIIVQLGARQPPMFGSDSLGETE